MIVHKYGFDSKTVILYGSFAAQAHYRRICSLEQQQQQQYTCIATVRQSNVATVIKFGRRKIY